MADEVERTLWKIESQMEELLTTASEPSNQSATQSVVRLESLLSDYNRLLINHRHELAPYLREKHDKTLRCLKTRVTDACKSTAAPRKKFSFKQRREAAAAAAAAAAAQTTEETPSTRHDEAAAAGDEPDTTAPTVPPDCFAMTGRHDEQLSGEMMRGTSDMSHCRSIMVTRCSRCVLEFPVVAGVSSVSISDVEHTVILLPPTAVGSVSVRNARHCTLVAPAQQVRLDGCTNCRLFVWAPPRAAACVLENCTDIAIGPLHPSTVVDAPDRWAAAWWPQGASSPAMASPPPPVAVKDFDWLHASQASPNWSRITKPVAWAKLTTIIHP